MGTDTKMNILQYAKSVNIDSLTNQEKTDLELAIATQLFYQERPNEELFELKEFVKGVFYHDLRLSSEETPQNNCRQHISIDYSRVPTPKTKKVRKILSPEKKFPMLKRVSDEKKEPIYFYKEFIREFLHTLRWISIQKNGQTFFIPQNQKGGENYMKKVKWSVIDSCKEFDKRFKHCYFITLTIDPKQMNLSMLDWWKEFPKHRSRLLKKLQEEFGGGYVWTNEAQLNGRPHSHILWYTDYDFTDTKFNRKNKKKKQFIESGKLFDFVHKWYKIGFIQMDINRRKNTYNYLVKYITKSVSKSWKMALKKSKRDKEDCKDILGLVCSIYTHTRMWGTSLKGFQSAELSKDVSENEFSTFLDKKSVPTLEKRSLGAEIPHEVGVSYLKTLSINFLPSCLNKIGFYSQTTLEQKCHGLSEFINQLPEERKAKIHNEQAKSACMGCIKTDILAHYLGDKDVLSPESDNFNLFFPAILTELKEISAEQNFFQKEIDEKETFGRLLDCVCKELFGDYVPKEPIKALREVFTTNWRLWIFINDKEIRKRAYQLRLRERKNTQENYQKQKLFSFYHQKFHDFFLTSSASGIII